MGGRGSGNRWNIQTPRYYGTVERVPFVLDVRRLAREGLFHQSCSGQFTAQTTTAAGVTSWSVELDVDLADGAVTIRHVVESARDGRQHVADRIRLAWTACHFGGRRPWFRCPTCWRRCALLYGTGRAGVFGWRCRTCSRLRHASTRENDLDRAMRRVRWIRRNVFRLPADHDAVRRPLDFRGWDPPRPVGMHRTTYRRRLAELRDAEHWLDCVWLYDLASSLASIGGILGADSDPVVRNVLAEGPPRRRDVMPP